MDYVLPLFFPEDSILKGLYVEYTRTNIFLGLVFFHQIHCFFPHGKYLYISCEGYTYPVLDELFILNNNAQNHYVKAHHITGGN